MAIRSQSILERDKFEEIFGSSAELVVKSPGRVNIIGEHTDYNDGFVFPATIKSRIRFYVSRNGSGRVKIYSWNFDEVVEFELNALKRTRHWSDYVKGVLSELIKRDYPVEGFNGVIGGNIPIGSGLSSSASLEMAVSEACARMFDFVLDPLEQIKLCRRAENQFVGVGCGIMDQFVIRMGRKNHGLFLDCRSLDYELVPIPSDEMVFVIAYSGVKRGLGATEYHLRQKQCQRGRLFFSSINKSLRSLRDVTEDLLVVNREKMDPVIFRRCRHVITENKRVLQAVEALKKPDITFFGELMNLSHESCKNDYEVSSKELDLLVELARMVPGVLGSRMTGAGFGGCTLNLVMRNRVEEFQQKVGNLYARSTGLTPQFYVTHAEGSVKAEKL
ncbi:MAG TPA: galactokinase [archaeon]|nr:galactokinase [archaeon]